jgi:DNA polymerase III epsilon subunit family exonuclease
MNNKYYFDPDYNRLNRSAKRSEARSNGSQVDRLLNRLLRVKSEPPVIYDPEILLELSTKISKIKDSIDWGQELEKASFIVFDTETTGLRPFGGDEVTSLGAVVIEKGNIIKEPFFYSLVNPMRPITLQAQKITGITNEMVRQQPTLIPVLIDFLDFCGPRILVAHNAPFDLAFLNNKIGETIGRRIVNPVIDTVLLTSALHYSIGDYSLENLARIFKFSLEGRHNALGDARIAASLFLKLASELQSKGISTLHQLAGLFSDADLTKGYPLIF